MDRQTDGHTHARARAHTHTFTHSFCCYLGFLLIASLLSTALNWPVQKGLVYTPSFKNPNLGALNCHGGETPPHVDELPGTKPTYKLMLSGLIASPFIHLSHGAGRPPLVIFFSLDKVLICAGWPQTLGPLASASRMLDLPAMLPHSAFTWF